MMNGTDVIGSPRVEGRRCRA